MWMRSKYHHARSDQVTERQLHIRFKFHRPLNIPGNFPVAMGYNPTVHHRSRSRRKLTQPSVTLDGEGWSACGTLCPVRDEGPGSSQLHHHLANIFSCEEAEKRAHRLLNSFHNRFLVLQFAGAEIAAHFFFKFALT